MKICKKKAKELQNKTIKAIFDILNFWKVQSKTKNTQFFSGQNPDLYF